MQNQPGDALLTGQVSGQKVGQAILQLLPSMPFEGPPFLPRFMARQLFPAGFLRQQPALPEVLQVPPTIVAPPAVPAAPPPNQGNHPRPPAPAPPVAAARQPAPKLQDRSFDPEMRTARAQRIPLHERPGL